MTEPLASPTLALLYLAQGHRGHARRTLDEVLATEPDNGYALALDERMRRPPVAQLSARFVASSTTGIELGVGELEISWTLPRGLVPPDQQVHVIIAFASPARESLFYTSIPCLDASATTRVPAPLGPASAALTLVAQQPGGALTYLSIPAPQTW
jgi:hypothetical protein